MTGKNWGRWMVATLLAAPIAGCAHGGDEVSTPTTMAAPASAQPLSQNDLVWLQHMARGSAAEINAGNLAQMRGQSEQVRYLGTRLVSDHQLLLNQEAPVATSLGVNVKEQPSEEQKLATQRLENVPPQQFDAEFVKMEMQDHDRDIKMTEAAAQSNNPAVRNLAEQTLPVLLEHEKLAKQAAQQSIP